MTVAKWRYAKFYSPAAPGAVLSTRLSGVSQSLLSIRYSDGIMLWLNGKGRAGWELIQFQLVGDKKKGCVRFEGIFKRVAS